MRILRLLAGVTLVLTVIFAAFVRLSPNEYAGAHQSAYSSGLGEKDGFNIFTLHGEQKGDGITQMQALEDVILATPRTEYVQGSIESGMITYVTRSKFWGFPDFTTVERNVELIEGGPPALAIQGRARFGASDFGVNKRRIRGWLDALKVGR